MGGVPSPVPTWCLNTCFSAPLPAHPEPSHSSPGLSAAQAKHGSHPRLFLTHPSPSQEQMQLTEFKTHPEPNQHLLPNYQLPPDFPGFSWLPGQIHNTGLEQLSFENLQPHHSVRKPPVAPTSEEDGTVTAFEAPVVSGPPDPGSSTNMQSGRRPLPQAALTASLCSNAPPHPSPHGTQHCPNPRTPATPHPVL